MADIRKFFGGGGESVEKQRQTTLAKQAEKRKFCQKKYDTEKRKRSVQASWLTEFEWAELNETDVGCELFCVLCRKYPKLSDSKSNLVIGLKDNFRKESLKFHDKSKKHIQCSEHDRILERPQSAQYAKAMHRVDEKNTVTFEKLFTTAYYVAVEGEPFSKFARFCQLQSKNGLELGTNYINDHACKTFTENISEVLKSEVAQELRESRFVSVLTDGSTDKGIIEQEVVYVRYVSAEGEVKTRFADIVNLEHGHARGVKTGILQALSTVGLSEEILSKKLVGINTDGAAVNLGKKGGAVKLLIDDLKEGTDAEECGSYITVVHCIAHNLELAVCDTKKDCKYLKKFEDVLKGIFKLYFYSPKRRRELYAIAESLNCDLKRYGGVQEIRWVASQSRALTSLLNNYEVTLVHLGEIATGKEEASAKARNYLPEMKTERFLKMLHFMIDFTSVVTEVSKAFQQKKALISEVHRKVESLRQKLLKMKTKKGKAFQSFLEESKDGKFKGNEITTQKKGRTDEQDLDKNIDKDIDDILDTAEIVLQERFIKHLGGEPHSLFTVFDFNMWPNFSTQPEDFRCYGDMEIQRLVEIYSPLLTEEEKINAVDEWLELKMYMKDLKGRPLVDAYEFSSLSQTDLKHIMPLVAIMLTISPSTADCERGFSCMNRLKTNLRTSMNQDTLRSLMRINMDGPTLEEFQPHKHVLHWLQSGKGRRHIEGHKCPGPRAGPTENTGTITTEVRAAPTASSDSVVLSSGHDDMDDY